MNSPKIRRWMYFVLPTLAMSLGWGLRGQLGHSTGAMVPGAIVALILCALLPDKQFSRGMVIGLGAIAFGYGATITTQDTAQMADGQLQKLGSTLTMDYSGLAIKGAIWALFGGLLLGLALVASRYRWKDIVAGMALIVAGFAVGWTLIDKPRPLLFSVTRYESWGGFLVAGILLLAWLSFRGRTNVPLLLGLCAAIAGGLGFPFGVFLNSVGLHSAYNGRWHDWWKVAETTYGACMGLGLGIGTYLVRDKLPDRGEVTAPAAGSMSRGWGTVLGLGICAAFVLLSLAGVGEWLVPGSILACAVFYFPKKIGWHLGITVTVYVTAVNVITYWMDEQKIGNPIFLWALVCLLTAAVSWKVTGWWDETDTSVRGPFLLLMWTIAALTAVKTFIVEPVLHPSAQAIANAGGRGLYTMQTWGAGLTDEVGLATIAVVLTGLAIGSGVFRKPTGSI